MHFMLDSTLQQQKTKTGGNFACACVLPLNDNSGGALQYFPTKNNLQDKYRTFSMRVFSCRFFSSIFCIQRAQANIVHTCIAEFCKQ